MPSEEGLDLEGGIYLNSSIPYHYIHSTCSTHIDSGLRSQPTPVRQPSTNRHVERSGPRDWVARQIRIWRWTIDDLTNRTWEKRRLTVRVGWVPRYKAARSAPRSRPSVGKQKVPATVGPQSSRSVPAPVSPLAEGAAPGGSASRPSAVPSDRARLCRARRYIGEGTVGTYPPPIYREISTATRVKCPNRKPEAEPGICRREVCVSACVTNQRLGPQQRPPVMSWLVGGAFF